jgi:hypothetical protein
MNLSGAERLVRARTAWCVSVRDHRLVVEEEEDERQLARHEHHCG